MQAVLVLQLSTSPALSDASVTSVTEYLLAQPILSFTVSAPLPADRDNDEFSGEDSGEEDLRNTVMDKKEFDSRRNVVLLKLHCVHTRYDCTYNQ